MIGYVVSYISEKVWLTKRSHDMESVKDQTTIKANTHNSENPEWNRKLDIR
jgi:hypothetical protein